MFYAARHEICATTCQCFRAAQSGISRLNWTAISASRLGPAMPRRPTSAESARPHCHRLVRTDLMSPDAAEGRASPSACATEYRCLRSRPSTSCAEPAKAKPSRPAGFYGPGTGDGGDGGGPHPRQMAWGNLRRQDSKGSVGMGRRSVSILGVSVGFQGGWFASRRFSSERASLAEKLNRAQAPDSQPSRLRSRLHRDARAASPLSSLRDTTIPAGPSFREAQPAGGRGSSHRLAGEPTRRGPRIGLDARRI
jgi:hypothetical protein